MISAIIKDVQEAHLTPINKQPHDINQGTTEPQVIQSPNKGIDIDGNDGARQDTPKVQNDHGDVASSPGDQTQKTVIISTEGSPLAGPAGTFPDSPEILVTEHEDEPAEEKNAGFHSVPWSDNDDIIGDHPVVMPMPLLNGNYRGESDSPSRHREKQINVVTNHNLFLAADFDDVLGPTDEVLGYRSWHHTTSMEHLNEVDKQDIAVVERPRLKSSISAPQLKVQADLFSVPSILDQMQYELPAQRSNNAVPSASCHVDEYKLDSINFDKDVSSTESQKALPMYPSDVSKEPLNQLDVVDGETGPDQGPDHGNGLSTSKYNPSNFEDTKSESYEERGSSSSNDNDFEAIDFELDNDDFMDGQEMDDKNAKKISENDRTFTESSSFEKELANATKGDGTPNNLNNEQQNMDKTIEYTNLNDVETKVDYKEAYSEEPSNVANPIKINTNTEQDSAILKQENDEDDLCHVPTITELASHDDGFAPEASYRGIIKQYSDEKEGDFCHVPRLTDLAGDDDSYAVTEAFTSCDVLAGRRWSEDDKYETTETQDSDDSPIQPKPPPGRSERGCISAR